MAEPPSYSSPKAAEQMRSADPKDITEEFRNRRNRETMYAVVLVGLAIGLITLVVLLWGEFYNKRVRTPVTGDMVRIRFLANPGWIQHVVYKDPFPESSVSSISTDGGKTWKPTGWDQPALDASDLHGTSASSLVKAEANQSCDAICGAITDHDGNAMKAYSARQKSGTDQTYNFLSTAQKMSADGDPQCFCGPEGLMGMSDPSIASQTAFFCDLPIAEADLGSVSTWFSSAGTDWTLQDQLCESLAASVGKGFQPCETSVSTTNPGPEGAKTIWGPPKKDPNKCFQYVSPCDPTKTTADGNPDCGGGADYRCEASDPQLSLSFCVLKEASANADSSYSPCKVDGDCGPTEKCKYMGPPSHYCSITQTGGGWPTDLYDCGTRDGVKIPICLLKNANATVDRVCPKVPCNLGGVPLASGNVGRGGGTSPQKIQNASSFCGKGPSNANPLDPGSYDCFVKIAEANQLGTPDPVNNQVTSVTDPGTGCHIGQWCIANNPEKLQPGASPSDMSGYCSYDPPQMPFPMSVDFVAEGVVKSVSSLGTSLYVDWQKVQCVYPWVAVGDALTSYPDPKDPSRVNDFGDLTANLPCIFHRGCALTADMMGSAGSYSRTQIFGDVNKAMSEGGDAGNPKIPEMLFGKTVGIDSIGQPNRAKIWPLTPVLSWTSNSMSWKNPKKLAGGPWSDSMETTQYTTGRGSPYNGNNRKDGIAAVPDVTPAFKGLEVISYSGLPSKPLFNIVGKNLGTQMESDRSFCKIYGRRF